MQREFRKIGEEYRRANTEGFASIVRSMQDVNQGMAFGPYDALIARAEDLKDASFADGMAVTKTSKSRRPRAVAQSASGATTRKSGVVKRRTQSKKAKSKRR